MKEPRKTVHFSEAQVRQSARIMSPRFPRLKPIIDIEEQARCQTANLSNDTTYVFTEKYTSADGKEKDYGAMKPVSIKPYMNGYRLIFRDEKDGIIVDTKIKGKKNDMVMLTASSKKKIRLQCRSL